MTPEDFAALNAKWKQASLDYRDAVARRDERSGGLLIGRGS